MYCLSALREEALSCQRQRHNAFQRQRHNASLLHNAFQRQRHWPQGDPEEVDWDQRRLGSEEFRESKMNNGVR